MFSVHSVYFVFSIVCRFFNRIKLHLHLICAHTNLSFLNESIRMDKSVGKFFALSPEYFGIGYMSRTHSKNMNQLVVWWAWQNSNDRRSTVCYFWIYSINHLNEKCFLNAMTIFHVIPLNGEWILWFDTILFKMKLNFMLILKRYSVWNSNFWRQMTSKAIECTKK